MARELHTAKQAFLAAHGADYGYNGWMEQHWAAEVGQRLGPGQHYLDMTGEHDRLLCKCCRCCQPVHCPLAAPSAPLSQASLSLSAAAAAAHNSRPSLGTPTVVEFPSRATKPTCCTQAPACTPTPRSQQCCRS
jgi:hypothetical protein